LRRAGLAVSAVLLFSLVAQAAAATDISRDEYRERVEPICKANTEANERILAGARNRVRAGEYGKAAAQFRSAAKALKRTRLQLLAVPMPAGDEPKLSEWLDGVKAEVGLLERVGQALTKGDLYAAQKLVVKLSTNANRTNAGVLAFEFTYCWFQPSLYT
jgi:hypothetical protein